MLYFVTYYTKIYFLSSQGMIGLVSKSPSYCWNVKTWFRKESGCLLLFDLCFFGELKCIIEISNRLPPVWRKSRFIVMVYLNYHIHYQIKNIMYTNIVCTRHFSCSTVQPLSCQKVEDSIHKEFEKPFQDVVWSQR